MKTHQKIDRAARDLSKEVHEANFTGAKMKSERRYATLERDYPDPDKLREVAGQIKQHTLEHLDQYLEQAEASFKRNGAQVHYAIDDEAVNATVLRIMNETSSKTMVKSKSMLTEEVHMLDYLEKNGKEVIKTDQGGAAILVADVMGHGVRAAMVTAMIQIAVHQLRSYATQPAEFMTRLNDMMQRTMQPSGETMFATAVYCNIDLETKRLTYVQAGARHGIHVPAEPSQDVAIFNSAPISPALGLLPETHYIEASTRLNSGDEIVLYTDGIVEAGNGDEEYSEARLIDFLMKHRHSELPEMIDELLKSVQEFTLSKDLNDDVCLIALRIP